MVIYACQEQVGTIIHGNNCCSYLLYDNGYFFAVVQIAVTSVKQQFLGSIPNLPFGNKDRRRPFSAKLCTLNIG